MNDKQPQLVRDDIFVNPIYRGHDPQFLYLDKECDNIINNIKKQNQIKLQNGDIKTLPNSYHSENLWQHAKFQTFIQFVMKQMWEILSSQGYDLNGRVPLLQECWVQEFPEEGGFHDIHIHSNNHMSGFYFLKCTPETSRPSFHDPRPGKTMTDLKPVEKNKVNVCNSQVHYPVKPGQFIFFNSWMPHAYSHHKGKEKFRFIHFNMAAALQPSSVHNADKVSEIK
tara:strand:- start:1222 stop:1896 length:675 start_codon:yes stop_codon:yes gene_type:complete